jgi:exosortase A-associated hydrolase 2
VAQAENGASEMVAGGAARARAQVRPFFLDTPGGRIFAVHHAPPGARRHVLCVPPFNEEMNRCRSMLTLQAQALAGIGCGLLVVDLFGTGDSEGGYVDARWERWLGNLSAASLWLASQGGCVALLGIRLGVILAADWLGRSAKGEPRALVAWQPVIDGRQYLTQFLRIRIAANMDRKDLPKETTASMREQFAAGRPVEIGGYEIHPELAGAIEAAHLSKSVLPTGTRIAWLEQLTPASTVPSPAGEKLIAEWTAAGLAIDVIGFEGQAFWQLHERSMAMDAIKSTTAWIETNCVPT